MIDPERDALLARGLEIRIARRIKSECELVLPAVPALIDDYAKMFFTHFESMGRPFDDNDKAHMRQLLLEKLEEGFAASPHSNVFFRYSSDPYPKLSITYRIAAGISTMADEYGHWVATRETPLFGKYPDAKVMDVAATLPKGAAALDIGAGSGRNALPLARAGLVVDALEPAPALADVLEAAAKEENTELRILRQDALAADPPLDEARYALIVVSEVTSHFRSTSDLRTLFEHAARALAPGGTLLVNAFLGEDGWVPDEKARQMAQVTWCSFFTRDELAAALADLPLTQVSEESVVDYEKERLPDDGWPPTGWYLDWSQGRDLFGMLGAKAPISLFWLVYRKT